MSVNWEDFTPVNPPRGEVNWDEFTPVEQTKDRTAADVARDVGITALKGAIALPQAFVGLADIPTGGRVGRTLESLGFRPAEAQRLLDSAFSAPQQAANRAVREADGFVDTTMAALENPSAIAVTVGESLPLMLGGAGIARGVLAAAPKVGALLAGAAGEGIVGAGSAASQIREESDDGLLTPKQSAAAIGSGLGTAALGAAGGKIAQRLGLGDIDTMLASGKLATSNKGFVRQLVGSGISEGVFEELPQSIQEQMWQNFATGRPIEEGVGNAAAMGMLAGAAMGGAGGGFNAAMGAAQRRGSEQDQAAESQVPAGAEPARPSSSSFDGGVPEQTAAEKALREPVRLTALDRVNEIDRELAAITARQQELAPGGEYGPTFDQERTELAQRSRELGVERETIASTWPKHQAGAPTSFSTEAGARLEGQYALVEADELVTSHDARLRPNPLYPQELQPRDRSRAASEMQVQSIVGRLDPARLGVSADAATGAPIVGADGLVESGNARTIALKRVYQANGQKAADYRAWLEQSADQFGLTADQVQGMRSPVLVRVRTTPVNRAEFARQANASTVQRMSPSEQALSDAKRLASLEGLEPTEDGDFTNSRDFIRQFMAMLPITEQNDMLEADGKLSTGGYRRIQNAVLAKAYGDAPTLRRMTESLDDNLRNVTKALVRVAPTIAAARERMDAGTLHAAHLAPDLLQAVEGLSAIKDKGWTVEAELGQGDIEGPRYSPEASQLLRFIADNIRSPRRIAEFLRAYYEALEAAGDPSQGSLLGDPDPAPDRADLLQQAKRGVEHAGTAEDAERRVDREGASAAEQSGRESTDATGDRGGDQGPGPAGAIAPDEVRFIRRAQGEPEQQGEWVVYPEESGTLGIPRKDMPQVKGEDRGALINFLSARGISHKQDTVDPDTLKPTQAEFSRKKVEKFVRTGAIGERSVIVSSDGHVVDGHHQWMGHQARGEAIPVIRLSAPIREVLGTIRYFPSVRASEGARDTARGEVRGASRERALQDFRAALADLAALATRHTRLSMVPENTPGLMPTLVKLFDAAVRVVGTDLKAATAWVKGQLRNDPKFKPFWNKIAPETYRKAALQAIEQRPGDDLLGTPVPAAQPDLFSAANVPTVAMIDGRPYDMARHNFKPRLPPEFLTPGQLQRADEYVALYYKPAGPSDVSEEARAHAEAALAPLLKLAGDAKAEYDQKVIDIARKTGALGQMLAPLKSLKRAAEKVALDYAGDASQIKDLLRSTIVVNAYSEAPALLEALREEFDVLSVKDKTTPEARERNGGYSDFTVFVRMPNGVKAEIQINTPAMLSIKEHLGHKLYEAARAMPNGEPVYDAMREIYDAAFSFGLNAEGGVSRKVIPPLGAPALPGESPVGRSSDSSSENRNQRPSGNITNSSPEKVGTNRQPSGNLSGTFIAEAPTAKVPRRGSSGYIEGDLFGVNDADSQRGEGGDQEQGARPVSKPGGKGRAQRLREDALGRDLFAGRDDDAGAARAREVGRAGPDGVREATTRGRRDEPRSRAGRGAGVPAGRDVPLKSGLNYAFGSEDLTYEGSWARKAEQNIEAVELLKRLEQEGRQATREEQSVLARFVGWGASDLANNLFGKRLAGVEGAVRAYQRARAAFDGGLPSIERSHADYWAVYQALAAKGRAPRYGAGIAPADVTATALGIDSADVRYLALRDRLEAALTPDEWAAARRSTQYAHYTSKAVVRSMWGALERMGFKGGAVLEPGAGIGVFPGLMPQAMAANSVYTGIEFDSITGGILRQLFPDERILVESFVDSKLPKNFYDVAVGNPPFSGTKILSDPEYAKRAFSLHDYFFAKSIDRVKPGGLVVYVTSRYTMDKLDDKARQYLADRADLLGAIRLPQTAFQKNAGTEVVTDVIFLRKKVGGERFEAAQPWAKSVPIEVNGGSYAINEYFASHPEMVLGKHADTGSMYARREYTVEPVDGDIEAQFAKAVERLPADIFKAERGSSAEATSVREIDFNPKAKKEGNYYVSDSGALMVREGGVGQRVELRSAKDVELIKDFVPLRDALKQAHYDQLNDGDWESSLAALQRAYASFTAKHGKVNQFTTKIRKEKVTDPETGESFVDEAQVRVFPLLERLRDDPDHTLVQALETLNDDTGEIAPSAFLTDRVLGKVAAVQVATPADALLSSLNDVGRVDVPLISSRLGLSEADTVEALGTAIYEDPETGWTTADEYLSGNVKRRLAAAREAALADKRFERNVAALEAVQPTPKTPSQINVGIGMNWIPGEVYADFLRETAGVRAKVEWNGRTRQWSVQETAGGRTMQATADWGTADRNATDLLEHALTGRAIRITRSLGTGSDRKAMFDAAATEAANQKLEALKEAFSGWVWKDAARADRLVQVYNDTFNTTVPRSFDGAHLALPGTSQAFHVFDHVKRGAWRIIQRGNTYLAHAVGSGKTFQMVISAMEQKRLGLIKKPMAVVPNHMLKQFAHEWQLLYPAARLMVADENNFHSDNRRRFVSRVALSDLDGVVITHSAFKLLDLDPEFKRRMIEEQLDYMRAALEEAEEAEGKGGRKSPHIKQIEKQIENLEQKLEAALSSVGKDTNVRFDELGVDMLYVDEAHEFRKLDFATSRQVKGIAPAGSARALDLYMKARYLEERTPGRSLVMASGTPVTNTLAELYTVQRFMDRQALIDRGIEDFDSWAAMFGRERTVLEPNAAGKYEPVTRFSKFVNVPELTQMFREFADVLTADHLAALLGDKRPRVEGGARRIIVTPKTDAYAEYQEELSARVEASRRWKPSRDEPNNPDPMIRIIGDGRLAAIDMRFIDPSLPSDPDSKLNRMIDDVVRELKATGELEYSDRDGNPEPNKGAALMVFSDLGFGAGVAANRGFNARAWFEKRLREAGIAMNQVAFMSDYKKSAEKLKLFRDVNAGRVRLLVGSSKNMGTGVNAQQRLAALFHVDSPWYPADLEQREGRIVRQGNKNPLVRLYAYAAKGTYDENMWKMLASKQFFIDQALSGDQNLREIEDLDSQSQYDLAAAMVAEDPRVLQLAGAKAEIEKLQRLYRAHEEQRAGFVTKYRSAELTVAFNDKRLPEAQRLAGLVQDLSGDKFRAKVNGRGFDARADWGEALIAVYKDLAARGETAPRKVGEISGFDIAFGGERIGGVYLPKIVLATPDPATLVTDPGVSAAGLAMRAQNAVADVARAPARMRERISEARALMDALAARLDAGFPMAGMLADKVKEAADLEAAIAADSKPRAWWVERIDTGLGFEVEATSEAEAVKRAVATNGGSEQEWRATEKRDGAQSGADDVRMSRGGGAGLSVAIVTRIADAVRGAWANGPEVLVVEDMQDRGIPEAVRSEDAKQRSRGATGEPEGFFYRDKVYLVASQLSTPEDVVRVLAHEALGHFGLREVFGLELGGILDQIAVVRRSEVVAKLSEYGLPDTAAGRRLAAEEVLAVMAQSQPTLGFVRRAVAAVRSWLRGLRLNLRVSDAEIIRDFILPARARVERGAPTGRAMGPGELPFAFLRSTPGPADAAERAEGIIQQRAGSKAPLDSIARGLTRITGIERLTGAVYDRAAHLLDRYTPEAIKAGVVSDYGVPEAVIDQRSLLQGRQRVQLRKAGALIEKLSTLTRAESRVAYEWMNADNPQAADYFREQLPVESVKVLADVEKMIDQLSREAIRLGQLSPEAYERNRMAYLRRSYAKHVLEQTTGELSKRTRVISILGDQYRGRGMTEAAAMDRIRSAAPEWWGRKLAKGKADTAFKGEKFLRLERRANEGDGTEALPGMEGKRPGKLLEVMFWPAGEPIPARYSEWERTGTWEVRDVKGPNAVMWRDFTKAERAQMGEIDEARFAIAKTLHGMIHDVEVGRYLEWLARTQAKVEGEKIPGTVVEASERYVHTFKPGDWVKVPDTKIHGTNVTKYGKLAGRYLPGPVWNDLRQVVGGQFRPLGDTYAKVLSLWKTSKTALSPAVHTNNIMANFVMADWHDVSAAHVAKALRIILGASQRDGVGLLGRMGNLAARAGRPDHAAAMEVLNRYKDSGGDVGSWVTQEIATEQLTPLLDQLEKELAATDGASQQAQVGVMAALQHAMMLRFPSAWEAFKPTRVGRALRNEAANLIGLYQVEDDVFRLAAWLKAKEDGLGDLEAGKLARRSFLDYRINAPWIQAMRQTAWPFLSFTYRAVPMLLETAGRKPHKLMKLMALAGTLNALGMAAAGGDGEEDDRKLLPEEKAGKIWGMVPKLIRMPWNDAHGSPVYLDIRRYVPVGDVFDTGAGHSAVPILPGLMPGGPLVIMGEVVLNRSAFTGKSIVLDTDTAGQQAAKVGDHLFKAFAPNILGIPGTYATTGVVGSLTGRTDAFGRELSTAQAVASAFGVRLGAYPADVMRRNMKAKAAAETMEIDRNISQLKRQRQTGRIDQEDFAKAVRIEQEKKARIARELGERMQ